MPYKKKKKNDMRCCYELLCVCKTQPYMLCTVWISFFSNFFWFATYMLGRSLKSKSKVYMCVHTCMHVCLYEWVNVFQMDLSVGCKAALTLPVLLTEHSD